MYSQVRPQAQAQKPFLNLSQFTQYFYPAPQYHYVDVTQSRSADRGSAADCSGVQIGEYVLGTKICEGSYGVVRQAFKIAEFNQPNKAMYAIKVVPVVKFSDTEVTLQKYMAHPHVLRVIDNFKQGDKFYIVLEHCSGGDLFEYVTALKQPIEERIGRAFFRQMLSAALHLHRHRIVHHDIKLENFLLTGNTSVRLCDFGAAEELLHTNMTSKYKGEVSAPEKREGYVYDGFSADVYQLGKTLHEFLFCIRQPNQDGTINPTPGYLLSPELQDLLNSMLSTDPSRRLSLEAVAVHPWTGGSPLPGEQERRVSIGSLSSQNTAENDSSRSTTPPPRSAETPLRTPKASALQSAYTSPSPSPKGSAYRQTPVTPSSATALFNSPKAAFRPFPEGLQSPNASSGRMSQLSTPTKSSFVVISDPSKGSHILSPMSFISPPLSPFPSPNSSESKKYRMSNQWTGASMSPQSGRAATPTTWNPSPTSLVRRFVTVPTISA